MNWVGVQLTIRGMVQGVGFRYWCYRRARELALTGWVRNNPDGSVSVAAEGERSVLEEFIRQLKVGPSHASVSDVAVRWTEFTGKFHNFDITMS